MVGNFEIKCIIRVREGWITSTGDQQFDLGRGGGPRGATCKWIIIEVGAGQHDLGVCGLRFESKG